MTTHTRLNEGVWYLWNKTTDEITDAANTYSTWEQLAKITEDPDIEWRRVEAVEIGQYWVSTVFLGIDHSFANTEKDIAKGIWFETMIKNLGPLKPEESAWPYQARYGTAQEAREGHAEVVRKLNAALEKDPDNIDWESFYEQQPSETCRDENSHIPG